MELKSESIGGRVVFTVKGEVSATEARKFADTLMESLPNETPWIEIDLSECEYMCSNALGALAATLMVARSRGGDVVVTAVSHNIKKLFDITSLGSILRIRH